jgi:hypothetical protein
MIEPTAEMRQAIAAKLPGIRYPMYDADTIFDGIAAAVLAIVERDQAAELADLRALFQLQWTRSREADARWRAEDPEARANVWPDLGQLLKWLMDDADQARGRLAEAERNQAGPCTAVLARVIGTGEIWCELRHGHAGDHTAEGGTRWKERQRCSRIDCDHKYCGGRS